VSVDPTQPVKTEAGQTTPTGGGDRILIALLIGALAVTAVVVLLNLVGSEGVARESPGASASEPTVETPTVAPSLRSDAPASAEATGPFFTTPEPGASFRPEPTPDPGQDPWSYTAVHLRGDNGRRESFDCPPGGPRNGMNWTVWGTGTYTDDSSVCRAAVHAGLITEAGGGTITIEILPGLSEYPGTTANGVTTLSWEVWVGSFQFVGP
jgi:hypothetical protein